MVFILFVLLRLGPRAVDSIIFPLAGLHDFEKNVNLPSAAQLTTVELSRQLPWQLGIG